MFIFFRDVYFLKYLVFIWFNFILILIDNEGFKVQRGNEFVQGNVIVRG